MSVRMLIHAVVALFFANTAAYTQTYTEVPRSADGSFQGKLAISSEEVSRHTQGFVRELEVSFKWAGFFGQPVESYALRWQMGEVIRRSGKPPLRRSDLEKYPDLLERFDGLKPTEIILNTQVLAYSAQLNAETWREHQPNNYSLASNPIFASGTKTISRVPHLVIRRSGELGTDIIPSSPQNTQDFIRWNYLPGGADAEEAASNTLNLADRLRVGALAIDTLEVPFAAIDRIQKEYLTREKERAEQDDDFWGDKEEGEQEEPEQNTSDNSFWGDEGEQQQSTSSKDDFWACPDQSPDQSNDCWKKPEPKVAPKKKAAPIEETKSQTFEIVKNDNREWGVRSSNGRMVIPFSKMLILSYKDGVAKVAKPTESKEYTCAVAKSGPFKGALQAWTSLDVWSEGLMDHGGNWIITPKKKGWFGITDRRCRKFLPEVRRYARSNNIELIEDFDEYVKIGGKLQW